ncbi:hypothetical protein TraAM80_01297, partial [Trypanosoma rangeli]
VHMAHPAHTQAQSHVPNVSVQARRAMRAGKVKVLLPATQSLQYGVGARSHQPVLLQDRKGNQQRAATHEPTTARMSGFVRIASVIRAPMAVGGVTAGCGTRSSRTPSAVSLRIHSTASTPALYTSIGAADKGSSAYSRSSRHAVGCRAHTPLRHTRAEHTPARGKKALQLHVSHKS